MHRSVRIEARLLRAYALTRPEVLGIGSSEVRRSVYAATGSSTMSRVRVGSTLTPGPIVVANTTVRM
jgi:hypothetical protein